jgi:hypothetical protein
MPTTVTFFGRMEKTEKYVPLDETQRMLALSEVRPEERA